MGQILEILQIYVLYFSSVFSPDNKKAFFIIFYKVIYDLSRFFL